jgi:toxin ParE1/3/4
MKFSIIFSQTADIELDELVVYIGEDNPNKALEVSGRIFKKIDLLIEHPWLGRPGQRAGTREMVVDGTPYIVAYRVDTKRECVFILRILHHAQRWPEKL